MPRSYRHIVTISDPLIAPTIDQRPKAPQEIRQTHEKVLNSIIPSPDNLSGLPTSRDQSSRSQLHRLDTSPFRSLKVKFSFETNRYIGGEVPVSQVLSPRSSAPFSSLRDKSLQGQISSPRTRSSSAVHPSPSIIARSPRNDHGPLPIVLSVTAKCTRIELTYQGWPPSEPNSEPPAPFNFTIRSFNLPASLAPPKELRPRG